MALLSFMLLVCAMPLQLKGQPPAPGQQPSSGQTQHRPSSLAHLYWHFLDYLNHLDLKAADLDAQGGDGSLLRNHLQAALQFSDADFAQIRLSSTRLTAALKALDVQAAAIRAGGKSPSSHAQQRALAAQRETAIHSEIDSLAQALTPQKKAALDAFITQLFAPKNLVFQTSSTGSTAPAEVQQ
jgi:hypothetical protein